LIDSLPLECRPHAIRGDCNHGNEANLVECEKRGIPYLFELRRTEVGFLVSCGVGGVGFVHTTTVHLLSRAKRFFLIAVYGLKQ